MNRNFLESKTVPDLRSLMEKLLFLLNIFMDQDISKGFEISKGFKIPKEFEIPLEYKTVPTLLSLM